MRNPNSSLGWRILDYVVQSSGREAMAGKTLSDSDEIVEMLDGEFGQEHLANVWYSGHYHAAAIYSNTQPPDPTPKCA